MVGTRYEQLLHIHNLIRCRPSLQVISGDFVTTEDGTGIVHCAPTFGADDALVAKNFGVPGMLVLDENGNPRPLVDLKEGLCLKWENLLRCMWKMNTMPKAKHQKNLLM